MATQKKQQTNAASEHSAPRRPGLSLRTIAALIVIGVGLALVLLLVWSAGQLRAAARQETMVHAQAMVENMAWRYDRLVTDTRAVLTVLAQLPRLADDPLFCGDLLRRQQVGDDTFANLGVIGLDGQVLCSALSVIAAISGARWKPGDSPPARIRSGASPASPASILATRSGAPTARWRQWCSPPSVRAGWPS